MLVRELIDWLIGEVSAGRLSGSDPVPGELVREIDTGHVDAAEWLKGKTERGAEADGQKNT